VLRDQLIMLERRISKCRPSDAESPPAP